MLPEEYVQVLKIFHHTAPRSSLADIQQVFKEELGKTPVDLFQSFDVHPLGTVQ